MVLVPVLDFATETAVLLLSGCVSLVAVSGFCAGVTFLVCKKLKHLRYVYRTCIVLVPLLPFFVTGLFRSVHSIA